MLVGSRILELLKEQGLSQRQLADALHLNPNTVNGYIHGRRYPDCMTLSLIAAFLGTNTDYLLGNTSIRSYPDLCLSPEEGALVSHYRSMDEHCRRILMEMSATLHMHSRGPQTGKSAVPYSAASTTTERGGM